MSCFIMCVSVVQCKRLQNIQQKSLHAVGKQVWCIFPRVCNIYINFRPEKFEQSNEQWPDFGCEGIKVQRAHQPTSQCQGKKKKQVTTDNKLPLYFFFFKFFVSIHNTNLETYNRPQKKNLTFPNLPLLYWKSN
eukprot:TRINITY_DN20956_c0_g1_i1.p8 TRINITY_DN20956_c0_g1~~TRINITY_DN20956_c0_g1_i1.p8  ORF type:complete len:134 (+),score=7.42 TRINITY_DN20956_c0_g1_i1:1563-1964(+)